MKITVLAGDGIGVEVTREAVKVLSAVAEVYGLEIETDAQLIGGTAISAKGVPFPVETKESCLKSDAVLLGAVGAPEFDNLLPEKRPEIGLLQLRQALGGFANLRPSKAFPALIDSSPLRREIFEGTDLLIVRELLGGLYFGQPRGINETEAFNTMRYSAAEVERVARVAFESAKTRKAKVTSVDKANVLETSRLWRNVVEKVAKDYPEITLEHLFVDACAMHLVTNPEAWECSRRRPSAARSICTSPFTVPRPTLPEKTSPTRSAQSLRSRCFFVTRRKTLKPPRRSKMRSIKSWRKVTGQPIFQTIRKISRGQTRSAI